jgi:hypothetical protein
MSLIDSENSEGKASMKRRLRKSFIGEQCYRKFREVNQFDNLEDRRDVRESYGTKVIIACLKDANRQFETEKWKRETQKVKKQLPKFSADWDYTKHPLFGKEHSFERNKSNWKKVERLVMDPVKSSNYYWERFRDNLYLNKIDKPTTALKVHFGIEELDPRFAALLERNGESLGRRD